MVLTDLVVDLVSNLMYAFPIGGAAKTIYSILISDWGGGAFRPLKNSYFLHDSIGWQPPMYKSNMAENPEKHGNVVSTSTPNDIKPGLSDIIDKKTYSAGGKPSLLWKFFCLTKLLAKQGLGILTGFGFILTPSLSANYCECISSYNYTYIFWKVIESSITEEGKIHTVA